MNLNKTKMMLLAVLSFSSMAALTACDDATVVSHNISKDADNFKVQRRITFFNGITNEVMWVVEGNCSIFVDKEKGKLDLTCKHGEDDYRKHYLGLSDNSPYTSIQLKANAADPYHFKLVFKPESLVPFQNVEVR